MGQAATPDARPPPRGPGPRGPAGLGPCENALRGLLAEAYAAERLRCESPVTDAAVAGEGEKRTPVKNPPILISVLGFFGLMVGIYYLFAGLRILGFNYFGVFATAPATDYWGFWGLMSIVIGLIYAAAAWALWTLEPWGWLFAVILSVFALIFRVLCDVRCGPRPRAGRGAPAGDHPALPQHGRGQDGVRRRWDRAHLSPSAAAAHRRALDRAPVFSSRRSRQAESAGRGRAGR